MSTVQNKKQNWFFEHELFSKLTIVLIVILLIFFISELFLRFGGKKPGIITRYKLMPVDRLQTSQQPLFISDDAGVFKANLNYKWPKELKINSDGFRSIDFKYYKTSQKKILFLGDSFTWGGGSPMNYSFVDIVSKEGYLNFKVIVKLLAPNYTGANEFKHI